MALPSLFTPKTVRASVRYPCAKRFFVRLVSTRRDFLQKRPSGLDAEPLFTELENFLAILLQSGEVTLTIYRKIRASGALGG